MLYWKGGGQFAGNRIGSSSQWTKKPGGSKIDFADIPISYLKLLRSKVLARKTVFFWTHQLARGGKYLHIKFIYRKSLATREQFRMDDRGGDLKMIFEV